MSSFDDFASSGADQKVLRKILGFSQE